MALKREAILDALKAALQGVTVAAGYTQTVRTVQLGVELLPHFSSTDMPIVYIESLEDIYGAPETHGAGLFDNIKRNWSVRITGALPPTGSDSDIRAQGESFVSDLVEQLLRKRGTDLKDAGLDWLGIERIMGPDNFERSENGIAWVGIDLRVSYRFTPASL